MVSVLVTALQDRCVYLNQATTHARLGCSIHPSRGKIVSTLVFLLWDGDLH